MVRNDFGNWCGYAAVPPDHPFHGKDYNDVPVEVHGGLTYGDLCGGAVCHEPKPGEPDNVFWFGFDCAHAWDYSPGMVAMSRRHGVVRDRHDVYRDVAYVRGEVERLAEQLRALVPPVPGFRKLDLE